ncbi:MAG: ABC transporter substrate-binding protein [Betaproteobacteria bacterium]|nr:ABC transporter substrate-binding protein [Betaproteobacteria bacterium]
MNNRRKLLAALGASALTAPFAAFAQQQGKVWRVGFLLASPRPAVIDADFLGAFVHGMRGLGYIEGKNLAIEWRFAEGEVARLPGLAAELIELKADVLVAAGPQAMGVAQKATSSIPIVMAFLSEPVGAGFVKSLARPGGNITGPAMMGPDVVTKQLEMLLSFAPRLSRMAVMLNPASASHVIGLKSLQSAAQKIRVKILPAEVTTAQEIESAFAMMKREQAGAVIVFADSMWNRRTRQIAELALKNRLLSAGGFQDYVEAGCLVSYSSSFADNARRAATYVDKIFKGAKPADLPVEQPTTFELFINRKTAKALGLTIPQSLLISAEKVID